MFVQPEQRLHLQRLPPTGLRRDGRSDRGHQETARVTILHRPRQDRDLGLVLRRLRHSQDLVSG